METSSYRFRWLQYSSSTRGYRAALIASCRTIGRPCFFDSSEASFARSTGSSPSLGRPVKTGCPFKIAGPERCARATAPPGRSSAEPRFATVLRRFSPCRRPDLSRCRTRGIRLGSAPSHHADGPSVRYPDSRGSGGPRTAASAGAAAESGCDARTARDGGREKRSGSRRGGNAGDARRTGAKGRRSADDPDGADGGGGRRGSSRNGDDRANQRAGEPPGRDRRDPRRHADEARRQLRQGKAEERPARSLEDGLLQRRQARRQRRQAAAHRVHAHRARQ